MDKLKRVLSGEDDGNSDGSAGILERANQASTLAWGTRMKGFLICFILGVFCSILAAFVSKVTACLSSFLFLWEQAFFSSSLYPRVPVCCGFQVLVLLCSLSSTVWEISALWPAPCS